MIIRNKYLNISTDDVSKETDITLLKKWLVDIEENITCMDFAITQAKLRFYETGVRSDDNWFNRIQSASRLQKLLKIQIESRINELTEERTLDFYIVKVLKEKYTSKQWADLLTKATNLRDENTQV